LWENHLLGLDRDYTNTPIYRPNLNGPDNHTPNKAKAKAVFAVTPCVAMVELSN